MVSASKMRKMQGFAILSRPYANLLAEIRKVLPLLPAGKTSQLTATHPQAKKSMVIVISTNRGLVGSLNANLNSVLKIKEQASPALQFEYVSYGKKGAELVVKTKRALIADFAKEEAGSVNSHLYKLAKFVLEKYKTGEYKEVAIVYNHFVSALKQEARMLNVLPILPIVTSEAPATEGKKDEYIIEPSVELVVDDILPRLFETFLKHCVMENDACEHSARMLMMKNATDSAGDLIADLTLTFNQLRQSKITTELSEITAGKIALE